MSSPPLCPSVNTRHMGIHIFDLTEGVVCPHTAGDPAEEGPLPGRIAGAHVAVLSHRLADVVILLVVGAGKSLICLRPVHPTGPPYDAASYSAYLHNASHSQDTGWTSLGCKLVGEPITCTMRPEFCYIWCMDTSPTWCTPMCFISLWWLGSSLSHTGHTVASLPTVGSWYGTSATSCGLQSPLAGLCLSGERTLAASPS